MITHDETGHWTEEAKIEIERLWCREGKSASRSSALCIAWA